MCCMCDPPSFEAAVRREREAAAARELEAKAQQMLQSHPIGSERCWTSSDGDIAAGEVGTVVGLSAEKDKFVVEFRKGPRQFLTDELITVEV